VDEARRDAAGEVLLALEGRLDGVAGARVVADREQLLVGDELRLHDQLDAPVERLHLVQDPDGRAMGEGDEPHRGHAHGVPRGRAPLHLPRERAGAQIEQAVVRAEVAVAHVEGLVLHEQAHQLAVRDVDERLARLGRPVLRLGVGYRAELVQTV
jgi:hypothetical protein